MTYQLLDYNGLLAGHTFTQASSREIQGKFMLVERGGVAHLIIGNIGVYAYHADLLAKFCQDNLIAHDWIKRPANLAIRDSDTKLYGGGWIHVQPATRKVIFSGRSTAYGKYDESILVPVLATLTLPKGVTSSLM